MTFKNLASLVVVSIIGAVLIASPAQARFGGGGGWHGGGWRGGPGFVGRRAFVGRPFVSRAAFFPARRIGFHRRFVGPFFGAGVVAAGYSTCWTWVPTSFGWRRVWACGPSWGWGSSWGSPWGW